MLLISQNLGASVVPPEEFVNIFADHNAENWDDSDGTVPENPTTASVASVDVDGWTYGAETLPRLSYKAGAVDDVLQVARNGGGASNYEVTSAVTGLTAGRYAYIRTKLDQNTNGFRLYWQEAAQDSLNAWKPITGETGTGEFEAMVRSTASDHYPGFRCPSSTTGQIQIDYLRGYEIGAENIGEGATEGGATFWDITGMPIQPDPQTNVPPVGWSFDSATPRARAGTGSSNPSDQWTHYRNGAAAADANVRRTIACEPGDLVFIEYTITAASGNTLVQLEDGIGSASNNTGSGTHRLWLEAQASSMDVYARPSSTTTGTTTWGEFAIVVIPAALRP